MSNTSRSILGVVLILVITFCGTFIVSRLTERRGGLDLTEHGLFTLSDGTKAILAELQQPLTLRFFYSKEAVTKTGADQLRQFNNHAYYIRDLLRAYERESGGKLRLEEYDPRPYSEEAQEADRYKIQRWPLTEQEGFYFGLAITSETGGQQVVPFFAPQDQSQVEYKVSELIELAQRNKKPKLGILSSLPVTGGGMSDYMRQMMQMQGRQTEQPWILYQQIKRAYDVQEVATDAKEVGPEIDYLVVIHPKNLSEQTLYALDQFVMRGGKLLAFVDPYCIYADQPPQQPNDPFGGMSHDRSSNLDKLLAAWGLEMDGKKFAGDLHLAQRIPSRRAGGAVRFVGVLKFEDDDCFNRGDPIAQGLKDVDMVFPGILHRKDGVENRVDPLITTTKQGNAWSAEAFELGGPGGPDLERLAGKFQPGVEALWVAARISGKLKTAFPAGAPKAAKPENGDAKPDEASAEKDPEKPGADDAAAAEKHLAESPQDTAVVVVADVDMITDPGAFSSSFGLVERRNSNYDLVMNTLETLSGSSHLMSVRARPRFSRPFTVVDEIEEAADRRTQDKVKRINDEIAQFERELSELGSKANEKNVGVLQSEAIQKQRDLEVTLRDKRRELQLVQKDKLSAIESLGDRLKILNILGVPAVVLLFGIALAFNRFRQRRIHVRGTAA